MADYTTRDLLAVTDNIMLTVLAGEPIPTNDIDRLPPWRARLVVRMCQLAGVQLQDGTPEQFEAAVKAAGKADANRLGWWRAALGMPPRPSLTPAPVYVPPSSLPAGWSYAPGSEPKTVSGGGGTRTREGR